MQKKPKEVRQKVGRSFSMGWAAEFSPERGRNGCEGLSVGKVYGMACCGAFNRGSTEQGGSGKKARVS